DIDRSRQPDRDAPDRRPRRIAGEPAHELELAAIDRAHREEAALEHVVWHHDRRERTEPGVAVIAQQLALADAQRGVADRAGEPALQRDQLAAGVAALE